MRDSWLRNHEAALTELLSDVLLHYMRDPGWYEVTMGENCIYACQLLTILLLAFIKKRVPARQLQVAAEHSFEQINQYSEAADPADWVIVNADFLSLFLLPDINLWQAVKLKNSLDKAIFTDPGQIINSENKPVSPDVKPVSILK